MVSDVDDGRRPRVVCNDIRLMILKYYSKAYLVAILQYVASSLYDFQWLDQ